MIAYFDTSALVPLLITEAGTERARALWAGADRIASARLIYPEARAALAQARRLRRLTSRQLREAVRGLGVHVEQLDAVELDEHLARRSGDLAELHGLRGCDAVHLAAAARLRDPDLVLVSGDNALLEAATAEGLAVARVP